MKTKYTSINGAISDWIDDSELSMDEIDESLLKKWALDCIKTFKREDQYVHKLTLIDATKYRAELPSDYGKLCQVAYRLEKPKEKCGRREQITQWVQGTLEKDCQLEINLICDRCHKTTCDCNSPVLEVNVDRIWEQAHPELYHSHFSKIGRWGYGHAPESYYDPSFKLMNYKSTDFFQVGKHFIPECANINCKGCEESFMIEHPYIEVSFSEGEILLSYLGEKTDDDGNPMIPDITPAHEAIYWWIEKKWWWKEYRKSDNEKHYKRFAVADAKADAAIGSCISKLSLPDYHNLNQILEESWLRRSPIKGQYESYHRAMELRGSSKQGSTKRPRGLYDGNRHYPK